jgi:hypothetical protein
LLIIGDDCPRVVKQARRDQSRLAKPLSGSQNRQRINIHVSLKRANEPSQTQPSIGCGRNSLQPFPHLSQEKTSRRMAAAGGYGGEACVAPGVPLFGTAATFDPDGRCGR